MFQDNKRKVAEEFLSDFDVSGTKRLGNGPTPPTPAARTETQSKKIKVEESTSITKSNGESNVVTADESLKVVEKKKKEKKKKAKSYLDDL